MPTELTPALRTYKSVKVMSPAYQLKSLLSTKGQKHNSSAVYSGGAGDARAPPEVGGSEKGQSLISAYRSLAITTNTPGFNLRRWIEVLVLGKWTFLLPWWNFEIMIHETSVVKKVHFLSTSMALPKIWL